MENIVQTEQQIQMVQQNIQRYENMIKNTIALPMNIYNDLQRQYQRLANLYQTLKSFHGDLDGLRAAYNALFPGFGNVLSDFRTSYDSWSKQADRSIQDIFELTGVQLDDLVNPVSNAKLEANIESLLSTPEGRMQAIQATNHLTAMQLREARELRTLLAASLQQQAVLNAKQEKMDQAMAEHMRSFFEPRKERLDPKSATPTP